MIEGLVTERTRISYSAMILCVILLTLHFIAFTRILESHFNLPWKHSIATSTTANFTISTAEQ